MRAILRTRRMVVASHPVPAMLPAAALRGRAGTPGAASERNRASMPTNDELLSCMAAVAAKADRQAFSTLFRHFAPRLKSFLMRGGCSAELADELAQEAMVAVWRKAAAFDPAKATLATWIFTIARNLRIDHHRRGLCKIDLVDIEDWSADEHPAEDQPSPDALLFAAQREQHVRRALEALPAQQALLIRMSFFEEHPHAAIAQRLGMPLGTVKSRIRLAVATLRRTLDSLP